MGEFFKSVKFKVFIGVVALLFGVMLYSASRDGAKNIPKNLLAMVVSPFQKMTAAVSNATSDFVDVFFNARENYDDNERLKTEIDELNRQLVDYEKLKDENEELKNITGIKEMYPDFEITPAFVIGRDPADRYSSFTIDKGTLHGVSLNDPVMSGSGLIGIISEVSPINARVKTILSLDLNVSAFEIASKELGVVAGDVTLAQEGLCKMSILSEETKMFKGMMIVTAGSSGRFPKGVPIGSINDIERESHGVTMFATIKPKVDIGEVINVQVITDFLGQGSELLDGSK